MATVTTPTARTVARVALPDDARDALGLALRELPDPHDDVDSALVAVYPLLARLPAPILRAILDFGRFPRAPASLLVENLPTDPDLPPTPADGGPSRLKRTFVSEGCLLGLTQLIGEPVGFRSEKDGGLIHDVVPVESGRFTQSNQGSSVFLEFHTDTVYDPSGRFNASNPDFLVLLGVRADVAGQALTYYSDARDVVEQLDPADEATLRSPLFRMNAPSTYRREHAGGADVLSEPVPVLTGPDDTPEICLAASGVRPLGEEAEATLERLQDACRATAVAVHLTPGQALLVNNRKGVHARSDFPARFDGSDRWLQRTYVRRSLWDIRHLSTDRPRVHA